MSLEFLETIGSCKPFTFSLHDSRRTLIPGGGHVTRENVHHGKHTPGVQPEFKDEALKLTTQPVDRR